MKKSLNTFFDFVKNIRRRLPVRLTFFIILFFIYFVKKYIDSGSSEKVSDISTLLLKTSIFVFAVIILFSIATLLVSYFFYKKSGTNPNVKFFYTENNEIICEIACNNIIYPLAGVVKAELIYDKQYHTLIILKKKKGRQAVGNRELLLPDIKTYKLDNVTIFFQDFFRMFSLMKTFSYNSSISVLPVLQNKLTFSGMPFTQDNDEKRTDTVHKREGELLHFKNFESSDDIRRIVWPVYAKSKELIVRMVEMHNMYASKVDMYASFNNSFSDIFDKKTSDTFLNKYKTSVWEVYKFLKEKNEVNFIPDQKSKSAVEHQNEVSAQISGMQWHTNKLDDYLKKEKISVCCISSLVNSSDFEKIIESFTPNTLIVFVSLKSSIKKIDIKDIVREIFTVPENGVNWKWVFSVNRKKIMANDDSIRNILISNRIDYMEI